MHRAYLAGKLLPFTVAESSSLFSQSFYFVIKIK